ncbi:MAG TPA: hypothetical protein VIS27_08650 [Yeosuana sp.]
MKKNITSISEYDFLSENECNELFQKVITLKDFFSESITDERSFTTLGNSAWRTGEGFNYYPEMNNFMLSEFSNLYEKTLRFIHDKMNLENVKIYEKSPPGFNIMGGLKAQTFAENFAFHVDGGIYMNEEKENVVNNSIYTFTCLISKNQDRPFLEYLMNRTPNIDVNKQKIVNEMFFTNNVNTEKRKHFYKRGKMTGFDGFNIYHRVGANSFQKDELRITYQMHYFLSTDGNYYLNF